MKKLKYDEKKYAAAVAMLAEQIAAMAIEDSECEVDEYLMDEYAGDAFLDVQEKIKELVDF